MPSYFVGVVYIDISLSYYQYNYIQVDGDEAEEKANQLRQTIKGNNKEID